MAAHLAPSPVDLLAPLLVGPWAIDPPAFSAWRRMVGSLLARAPGTDPHALSLSDFVTARQPLSLDPSGIATISVQGPLADNAPPIWEKLGGTDYRSIRRDITDAQAAGASHIHLAIDSPGGTVAGLYETGAALGDFALHGGFLSASCSGQACSAAYFLAASADTIAASPSAAVGNIGTVLFFPDEIGFMEDQGIQFHLFTNQGADLKGIGRERLTPSQAAFLQEGVDQHGDTFRRHVQGGRPAIDGEVFRAGWYSGQRALDLGLIDTISSL